MIKSPCNSCPIVKECEVEYRKYMLTSHPNPDAYDHDVREFADFALRNSKLASCWIGLDLDRQEYMNRVFKFQCDGAGIAHEMKLTIEDRLILPLPLIGEPFQIHRFALYDYYGNLLKKDDIGHPKVVVDDYESDVDYIQGPYYRYFRNKIRDPLEESGILLPMTRFCDAENVFNRLYGGFDFNALMRMITTTPSHFDHQSTAFDKWVDEEFKKFFKQYCEYAGILPDQVPQLSYNNARDNFHFNMQKFTFCDYLEAMEYPVGVELQNGEVYELTGKKIYQCWVTSNLIKNLAASAACIQLSMDEKFNGKKRGFFEKIIYKRNIENYRKTISWDIYLDENVEHKFNIRDVIRFYPSPPGEPVRNPLLR